MLKQLIGGCLACAAAMPTLANEHDADEAPKGADWSVSASAGLTKVHGDGDQPFARLGVTRFIGDGSVRAAVTHFSTREGTGLMNAVPARTLQVSVGGSYSFGKISIDGYAAYGWRKFDPEAFRSETGRMIEIISNGRTASGGVTLTYDIELGGDTYLAPFVAADISRVDIARAIDVVGRGTISLKEKQTGTTGSLGLTLDHMLGDSGHHIGAFATFITTSNSAVGIRSSAPVAAARLFGPQDVPGSNDSWGEYGATATLSITRAVLLDLSVVRTAGFRGAESTSFSAGMRFRF